MPPARGQNNNKIKQSTPFSWTPGGGQVSFPSQHRLQSRESNSKAITGTHSMEVSSVRIVQCPHPPDGGHRGGPKSHTLGIDRQLATIKGSLASQDESLSRCGIRHSLAALSDLLNGLKRHFTLHLGMENIPGKNLRKGMFRRGSTASRGSTVLTQHPSLSEAGIHMLS